MIDMTDRNYISYASFLKDRENFRKSGSKNSEFNIYDTPSHKYFKILFYFGDDTFTSNADGSSNGLLHPTWNIFGDKSESELNTLKLRLYDYNSAWSFLKLNDENERAEKLEKFVTLLSNINCNSPWYFSSISGIDSALERKVAEDGNLEMNERKNITITCLPDAFDNRIGTLLDLYRDITWSWSQKKQILPSNLCKFDMAIYIFESPLLFWHKDEDNLVYDKNRYTPSYKMIEFRDCEFNYNSVKSGFSDINNQTGIAPTYTIDISYSDCYEISYNEILMREIGDVIATDTYQATTNENGDNISKESFESIAQKDTEAQVKAIEEKTNPILYNYDPFPDHDLIYSFGNLEDVVLDENGKFTDKKTVLESEKEKSGFLGNIAKELFNTGRQHVDNLLYKHTGFTTNINRALLGNLHTYSLTQMNSQVDSALKGHITTTGLTVKQYIDNAQKRAAQKVKNTGNLGNLYKNTIANN